MTDAGLTLDQLLDEALLLSDADRDAFRVWEGTSASPARQQALETAFDAARRDGLTDAQTTAMEDAYHNVAASAGVVVPWTWTYFGDDPARGDPWQPAARIAAEAAAALAARDVIEPETLRLLLEPWLRLARSRRRNQGAASNPAM